MNDNLDVELWKSGQYGTLVTFVHHLAYYRALYSAYGASHRESEFWKYTVDAHLFVAILDWSKVFGGESNKVHWKKIVSPSALQEECRSSFLAAAELSSHEWDEYWRNVKRLRDRFIAHLDIDHAGFAIPTMDQALAIAAGYDDWFRDTLIAFFEEPSLRERYDRVLRTTERTATDLLRYGPTIDDEYEGRRRGHKQG